MNVKYSFGNVRTMTFHQTTCRVNIWGYLNPIPINRVKKPVAYTLGQTYKCHIFLELSEQDLSIQQSVGLIYRVKITPFINPTCSWIDRPCPDESKKV